MDIRAHCASIGIEEYGEEVWGKMVERVRKICDTYGLVSSPEELLVDGLDELFYKDGTALEDTLQFEIEKGKKWAFGDPEKESKWATWAGD